MLKQILVAVHDAGAAEMLASMIADERESYDFTVVLSATSPAWSVFNRRGLAGLIVARDLAGDIDATELIVSIKPDLLLVGTGTSGFEDQFVRAAQTNNVDSVAWLDHWVNYRERFGYPKADWKKNLPDWVAVSDNRAFEMAGGLGFKRLLKLKNYYITDLVSKYNTMAKASERKLLYISESFEEHAGRLGVEPVVKQTELLTELLENISMLSGRLAVDNLVVRLHPAEAEDKYNQLVSKYTNYKIEIERPGDKELNESIGESSVVIGISSMALMISYLIGRPTISYCPISGLRSLPLPEVCWVSSLDDVSSDVNRYQAVAGGLIDLYEEKTFTKMIEYMESTTCENSSHH